MRSHFSKLIVQSVFLLATLFVAFPAAVAQQSSADKVQSIERNKLDNTPKTIVFNTAAGWQTGQEQALFSQYLSLGAEGKMLLKNETTTKMGITTARYSQYYKGLNVVHGEFILVSRAGNIQYAQGNFYDIKHELNATPGITEGIALGYALEHIGAQKYMWQVPGMEAHIQQLYHRADTSYLPHGKLVWIEDLTGAEGNRELKLAWVFDVYAHTPRSRQMIYVDANTGKILHTNNLIQHSSASNKSKYSGVVPFKTAHVGSNYVLYDSTRGNGVYTMSANFQTDLSATIDITSTSNNWPRSTSDTQAIDAHWGAEMVYDYWKNVQGRLSYDGLDGQLLSYIHLNDPSTSGGYDNAYWDGAEMNYGDGTGLAAGGLTPVVALDVAAHEIGHGVCGATCNLDYNRESGAMNEGFSDCWAATIEDYANPHETDAVAKQTWKIGEEVQGGTPLRNMDNPLLESDPATYGGTNWQDPSTTACVTPSSATNDNCYVHTNSGVLNHWYYLVVVGGSGTNDLGTAYSVNAIGFTAGAAILYQTELTLTNTSNYADCRTASINAATVLYGACSLEAQSITNAWHAVGIGAAFTPCTPQIGFATPRLNTTENSGSAACPSSRTVNIGLKAFGTAISGGSPIVNVFAASGTAVSGLDYTLSGTSLTFTPGDTSTHYATLTLFDNGTVHDNKTLNLAFTMSAGGSTATISPTNDTMFINIYNDDSVPLTGGIEYHTLNVGTAVTSNITSCFPGSNRKAHPEYLLMASELTAAGVRPGVPISQIAFTITTKNSTAAFSNYAVGMLNTTVTDLSAGYVNTSMTYSGNHTTHVGTDSIDFTTSFVWDGTSNVAVEMCYGPNSSAFSANDLMSAVTPGTASITIVNSSTSGSASSGCSLTSSTASLNTTRPVMRFKQVVPPAYIDTLLSSTRTWNVKSNTEVYFYNPTSGNLIAGLNSETNDLGCVSATVSGAGDGFTAASFSSGNRSLKEITITPTSNGPITTYAGTIYMTNQELSGVAPATLYLLKTSATTDAGINTGNTVTVTPTLITGSTYMGFTGTFTGFGRYMLVTQPFCPLPVVGPITGGTTVCVGGTLTLSDTSTGGVWSSTAPGLAGITTGGVVTGITPGIDTIKYTKTNSCGTASASLILTITTGASAGTVTGPASVCTGSNITLLSSGTGGSWSSASPTIATVNSSGTVTGLATGSAVISYTVTGSCGVVAATQTVTVTGAPAAPSAISGTSSLCIGGSATFTDATTGGAWSSSNTTVATISAGGSVTALAAGTTTISYVVSNGCGTNFAIATLNVTSAPTAGTISGPTSVCPGATISLTNAVTGGSWSSSAVGIATINSSGVVTGVATGTATISYAISSSCGSATTTYTVSVNATPFAGTVSGPATVCRGASITLTDATPGGTWSSSNAGVASVTGGVVSGVATGTATISYTVANTCGSASATSTITVNTVPTAGTITGATTVCTGATITLTNTATGGTWSSSNPSVASVNTSGIVTGSSNGAATISYSVSNSCGSAFATSSVTVSATPSAGTITGGTAVCVGLTLSLADAVTGGAWSSSSASIASVSTTGVVTGIATGSATISYSVTTSCGTAVTSVTVTVSPAASAGTISGASSLCTGTTAILTDATTGGVWTSSNASIASVSATGVVRGVSAGTATISYSVTSGCGTVSATQAVTVTASPSAGTITGATSVCAGSTTTLTNAVTGGTWSSSNLSAATVNTSGVVAGIAAGTATISYTVINSCGTATATHAITTLTAGSAGSITGSSSICTGTTTTLTDTSVAGTWSSSNASVASVTTAGVVRGNSVGTATISYTVSSTCGTGTATFAITVSASPSAGTISGASTVCTGYTTTLVDAAPGGTWSSSNTARATVSATGVVTGITTGAVTISYAVTNSCGTATATKALTINAGTSAGPIGGSSALCAGTTTTLTNSATGGTWSSSNPSIASINSAGVLRGVAAGTATITYSLTTTCGTSVATLPVSISATPVAGTISGAASVCESAFITLIDSAAGGTWTSSNASIATVNVVGVVTGVAAGSVTITYTAANSCGTVFTTRSMTVNPLPVAGTISGVDTICHGTSTILRETASGGYWSSNNTTIATVGSGGVVTGVTSGTTTISYIVTNSCGIAFAIFPFTVDPLPTGGALTGTTSVCAGATTTLSSSVTGGTWTSSNAAIASVNTSGVVTGITAGSATISYAVTGTCGVAYATATVSVGTTPTAGTITGAATICQTGTTTFANAVSGGAWSTFDTTIASITSAGVLTGIAAGTTLVSYTVSSACGTAYDTAIITVNPLPSAGTISGASVVCSISTATLSVSATGGIWHSSNTTIATVDATGLVTAVGPGTDTISYIVSNSCGTDIAYHVFSVNPLPNAGVIVGSSAYCIGGTATLTDSVAGGTWGSSNTSVASISAIGVVTGVAAGSALISYTVTNSCGAATTTMAVSVTTGLSAGTISGPSVICPGATAPFTATVSGGSWGTSNATIATVSASGMVSGVAVGAAVISYTVSGSCGSAVASQTVTIGATPISGTIGHSGPLSICAGSPVALSIASTTATGYQWFKNGVAISGATNATYSATTTGVYSAVISNSCAADSLASVTVTAGPTPVVNVIGAHLLGTGSYISYQWFLNGSAIAGATSSTYSYSAAGVYKVRVTDANGCSATSANHTVATQTNGVNTIAAAGDVSIYPNPATNVLHVVSAENVKVVLMTPVGKIVLEQKDVMDINISGLANGVYMVMVYNEANILVKAEKLVKVE